MGMMHATTAHLDGNAGTIVSGVARPIRRSESRRWDNVLRRVGRPLVTGSDPDHPAPRPTASGSPVFVMPPPQALPFAIRTSPRSRIGTVPKLAPGRGGSGLGTPIGAGFQSLEYVGFTPIDSSPSNQPNFRAINIPRANVVPWTPGGVLRATYKAHTQDFAYRFFNQSRSAGMWAQGHFPPQQRTITPYLNQRLLRNASNITRKMVPAGQINTGTFTIGYPTQIAVVQGMGGGGPVNVLGGGY